MSQESFRHVETFNVEHCPRCGLPFGLPQEYQNGLRRSGRTFYCPAGHAQHYSESEEERLKRQLEFEQRQRERAEDQASRLEQEAHALHRQYKRIRERIRNGQCPCCDQIFQDLAAHIQDSHPDLGTNDILRRLRTAYGLTQSALGEEIGISASAISNYENGRRVSSSIEWRIDSWLEENNVA